MKRIFRKIIRILLKFSLILIILYVSSLLFFYFKQERFYFNPKYLDKEYVYEFEEPFEEIDILVDENISINALHFKAENPEGIVLYLHGNAGALHDWGKRAHLFLENNQDVFFIDYRGYGKSDGNYTSDTQLLGDVQKAYDYVKTLYPEEKITVLGYSLGSGLAAFVASKNKPKQVILNAPYYSWKTLVADEIATFLPKFLVNFEIKTYEYLEDVTCPIQIFHGTRDYLINPKTNSDKLKDLYPEKINLTYIIDGAHNDIHISKQYYDALKEIFNAVI